MASWGLDAVVGFCQLTGWDRPRFLGCGFSKLERFTVLVPGTPLPPFVVKIRETQDLDFRPCARSLSFQELQAQSREHGSCEKGDGGHCIPIWDWEPRRRLGALLSKIEDYLVDNVCCIGLSCFGHGVKSIKRAGELRP